MIGKNKGRRQFQSPPGLGLQLQQPRELNCNIGHNGEKLVCVFTARIDNIQFTEEQAEVHIAALKKVLAELRAHKAGK